MWVKYDHWPIKGEQIGDLRDFQWYNVMHIVQTKPVYKNWRCLQKSIFTATCGLSDVPLVVLGAL
jgi:hypothetical protein